MTKAGMQCSELWNNIKGKILYINGKDFKIAISDDFTKHHYETSLELNPRQDASA